jgi:hypothetical protein
MKSARNANRHLKKNKDPEWVSAIRRRCTKISPKSLVRQTLFLPGSLSRSSAPKPKKSAPFSLNFRLSPPKSSHIDILLFELNFSQNASISLKRLGAYSPHIDKLLSINEKANNQRPCPHTGLFRRSRWNSCSGLPEFMFFDPIYKRTPVRFSGLKNIYKEE